MIVRNEATLLPGCLGSLRGVVDEIVVVDTGSDDGSQFVARDYGARVLHYKWVDDFSAARNHAIEHASGDWLLYIDADERVRPCDCDALRADLAAQGMIAATVCFRPRTGYTAYPEMRFIRRDDRLQFHGAMHETFMKDVRRLESEGAGWSGATRLDIDHVGYDGDQSHKLERNFRLLRKQLAADPERAYLHWHLGSVYLAMGQPDEAEASWITGIALVRDRDDRLPGDLLCLLELIKLRWARGEDVSDLLADADALQPGNHMVQWFRAKFLAAQGDHGRAEAIFEELAAIEPATLVDTMAYDCRIFGASAYAEIGNSAFRQGQFARSAHWYARAEALDPHSKEFRTKRCLAAARA